MTAHDVIGAAPAAGPQPVRDLKPDCWQFIDPATIPWSPWGMPGTWFKLLNINEGSGSYTFILKVDPGVTAPIHKHLGGAEGFILDGELGYGPDDRGSKGWYAREVGGAIHTPDSPDGLLLFAIAHGPIAGYAPDGSVAGIIDVDWMVDMAEAHGAAGHIRRAHSFTEA